MDAARMIQIWVARIDLALCGLFYTTRPWLRNCGLFFVICLTIITIYNINRRRKR